MLAQAQSGGGECGGGWFGLQRGEARNSVVQGVRVEPATVDRARFQHRQIHGLAQTQCSFAYANAQAGRVAATLAFEPLQAKSMGEQGVAIQGFGPSACFCAAPLQRTHGGLRGNGTSVLGVVVMRHTDNALAGGAQRRAAIAQGRTRLTDTVLRALEPLQPVLHIAVQLQGKITDGTSDGFNFRGGRGRFLGQLLHLVGNHGKSAPGIASARGLDCRVQCHQVGLMGNLLDHAGEFADLRDLFGEFALVAVHG